MTVPYTFGTATTSIPLSNLDANFNTPITLGNTSIYLGNTTTTIGNLTLTNVTISSGTANITSNITYTTANAVVYTNASSIGTTNSNLTWNGTNFGIGTSSPATKLDVVGGGTFTGSAATATNGITLGGTTTNWNRVYISNTTGDAYIGVDNSTGGGIGTLPYAAVFGTTTGTTALQLVTAGTAKLTILTGGNVGIGTSSPGKKLDILDSAATSTTPFANQIFQLRSNGSGADATIQFTDSVTYNSYFGAGGGNFYWNTTGAERMRIDSSGNVGIGTTVNNVFDQVGGARPLLVQKSDTSTTIGGSTASITISNGATTTSNTAQLNFAAITGASTSQYSSAVISAIFGARTNGQYPTGELAFLTSSTLNAAPTEKMRITSAGGLLVNTTSQTGSTRLVVSDATGNGQIRAIHSTGLGLNINQASASGAAFIQQQDNADLGFSTNNTERMRIDSSGNVMVTSVANLGYGTGSGGTVTQGTSRTTAVTINKPTGAITMFTAVGSPTINSFFVNNSLVTAKDNIILNTQITGASNNYIVSAIVQAAGFYVLYQTTGGVASDTPIINFSIIKGATT